MATSTVLGVEYCTGYFDDTKTWRKGFYCPRSEDGVTGVENSKDIFCCGTQTSKHCCERKEGFTTINSGVYVRYRNSKLLPYSALFFHALYPDTYFSMKWKPNDSFSFSNTTATRHWCMLRWSLSLQPSFSQDLPSFAGEGTGSTGIEDHWSVMLVLQPPLRCEKITFIEWRVPAPMLLSYHFLPHFTLILELSIHHLSQL